MGPPLSCLSPLVKTVSLTILTELWVVRGFDSCGRRRCRRVWSPCRHRHNFTSSQLHVVALLPSKVYSAFTLLVRQPANRQFLTLGAFLRREVEIIKIVLDCMKGNGIYPFHWCRIKKKCRMFWRPSYDRLRGRKEGSQTSCFLSRYEWGGKKRTVFPLPLGKTSRRVPVSWLILPAAIQFCERLSYIGLITSGVTLDGMYLLGELVILELM
jgi:hypothetical protein